MNLEDLFDLSEKDKKLSVETIREIFGFDLVITEYLNKWLIVKDDEMISDFVSSYGIEGFSMLEYEKYSILFQQDWGTIRLVISKGFINSEGEKDAEMYHFYIRKEGLDLDEVLIFYQARNIATQRLELITTGNMESMSLAEFWFLIISKFLVTINNLYTFNKEVKKMVHVAQYTKLDVLNQEPIIDSIFHNGVEYQVISLKKGFDLLKGLKCINDLSTDLFSPSNILFSNVEQDTYFLLSNEDVLVSDLELVDFIEEYDLFVLGYIFLGDLIVTNSLLCEDDLFSPSLIVKGNLTLKNGYLSGNTHYIGGDVYGEVLYLKNDGGELHINGCLDTSCIIAQDMFCYIRTIVTKLILSNECVFGIVQTMDQNGDLLPKLNVFPTSIAMRDLLIDEIREGFSESITFPNTEDVLELFNEGKSILNPTIANHYKGFVSSIAVRFNTMFFEIIDGKGEAKIRIKDRNQGYFFFNTFYNDGKKFREIGKRNNEANYQSRILHDIENDSYTAILEYYPNKIAEGATVYTSALTVCTNASFAVFYEFVLAENIFHKQYGKR